jgi:DNA-binding transcriptional MerR regulator
MADFTLQQLAHLAGVTPRTVRYYIAQGLLPSPGAGTGARYSDTHLQRLRLIKQLQRAHLPLAEIRAQLNRGSALDYLEQVLGRRADESRPTLAVPLKPAAFARRLSMPDASLPAGPPSAGDRSQWDRVALSADVELHIRRPLTRDQNRRVDRLIALGRQLLEEDQS